MFNVSTLLLDVALLKCIVIQACFQSVVEFEIHGGLPTTNKSTVNRFKVCQWDYIFFVKLSCQTSTHLVKYYMRDWPIVWRELGLLYPRIWVTKCNWCQHSLLESVCFSTLRNPPLDHRLDGYSCGFVFIPSFITVSLRIYQCTCFTHMAVSNAVFVYLIISQNIS